MIEKAFASARVLAGNEVDAFFSAESVTLFRGFREDRSALHPRLLDLFFLGETLFKPSRRSLCVTSKPHSRVRNAHGEITLFAQYRDGVSTKLVGTSS